ncbi:helix-turn-helix transcriptional regulator [Gallaecimonas sp. GXIMD4217]|uniref:helix-turn-helix domain-containing protein n=1 Tax=Gallaecimonas sp. GXIMD4217 TaxID=3131927 RepID=UPI00311B066C
MSLGNAIKSLRQEQQLSQPEFARLAGIEQSYLSKLENDKSTPSGEIFARILGALNLTTEQFMARAGEDVDLGQLQQVEQTRSYLYQARLELQRRRHRLQLLAIALIAFGAALFYCAYTAALFPERQYVYESLGVIKDGEPDEIYGRWSELVPTSAGQAGRDQKRMEMASRRNVVYRYSHENLGLKFVEPAEGGRRVFHYDTLDRVPRTLNGILSFVAIFCGVAGLLLLLSRPLGPGRGRPSA